MTTTTGCIDAHVHVWTPGAAHYPLAPGYKKEAMKPASFTPEELFKHTKPAGVDRINLIQMSFYGFENELSIYPVFPGSCRPCHKLNAPTPTFASLTPAKR